jgi:hypothetical protein
MACPHYGLTGEDVRRIQHEERRRETYGVPGEVEREGSGLPLLMGTASRLLSSGVPTKTNILGGTWIETYGEGW